MQQETAHVTPGVRFSQTSHELLRSLWALRDRTWVHLSLIGGLIAAVFANTLHNSLHLDDFYRIVDNPGIQQISRPWLHFIDPSTMATIDRIAGYRPLLPLTLSINYAIAGNSLVGYHLANIAIQFGAAWLVYLLVAKLLILAPAGLLWAGPPSRARSIALCVALIFAIHPIAGIPVNYICARDQLLSQLFWCASLLGYLGMHERGFSLRGWALTLVLLTASLMSKGDIVLAPLLVLWLEVSVLGQPFTKPRPWLHAAAFALPVVGLFLFQSFVLGHSEISNVVSAVDRSAYALTQARLHLWRYALQFFWPFSIHQDPWEPLASGPSVDVITGLCFIAATLAAAWWWRRRQPLLSFCIVAYWLTIAPTSSVIPLHHIAVDYRPYPGSPFVFLALCLAALQISWPARRLIAIGAIAWCATTTIALNKTWLNDRTLWTYSVDHGAGPLGYHNLAMATPNARDRRALLEHALRLSPGYILAKLNLGRTLVSLGEIEPGLTQLTSAIEAAPRDGQARYWYARTLVELGRKKDASFQADRAAQLDPRNATTVWQAVLAWQAVNEHNVALRWLDVLRNLRPLPSDYPFARGFSLQQLGHLNEAIATYREFLKQAPNHVQAHFNLGFALMQTKHCAEAIPEFERVLALDPKRAAAHLHLATCAREVGNMPVAQLHQSSWDASLRVKP